MPESVTLFVGGPADGRRISIPENQEVTEIDTIKNGQHERNRYYLVPLAALPGLVLAVAAHEDISRYDVLDLLIRRYPQPLNEK
jgi:hypothetical protein